MGHSQIVVLATVLVLLVLISGFFSAAETALMAVNRYRLRHKARLKNRFAILILRLLKRPDRVLGLILIGNSFANIFASALATLLAVSVFGNKGVVIATVILTLVILVFAEVAPKTLAALYSEQIAKIVVFPVYLLLKIFYPLVWFINVISNGLLRVFGIKVTHLATDTLSREELRSMVYETSALTTHQYRSMLLGILDLNKVTVNDVMVPRHEIVGIDLEEGWEKIQTVLSRSLHDWLPLYQENINNVVGVLHVRELMHAMLTKQEVNLQYLMSIAHDPYFVPESTALNTQLINFQKRRKRVAMVVDEYGEIQGLITLVDILEEIVGEFERDLSHSSKLIQIQPDGSYLVDGSVEVRDFNRDTEFSLPTEGPRTLSGLIIEYLETIPRAGTCVKIAEYPIEILSVEENLVKMMKIFPSLNQNNAQESFDK